VNPRLVAATTAVTIGLAFLVSWFFSISLGRAFVLGPVIVVGAGVVAMTCLLLVRGAIESARELRNPRRFWVWFGVACVVIACLSLLGVELPREG
jgi:predicted transcriptional regulator